MQMITNKNLFNTFSKLLILIALISGVTLTITGLSSFSWPRPIPWSDAATLVRFVGFLVVAAIFVILVSKRLHRNTSLAVVIATVLLAIVAGALWPLLVAVWFVGASSILGHWFLGRLKIKSETWVNSFLIGAGIYGTVVGLLAHFPVNYPGIYGISLAVPILLGRNILRKWFNEFTFWLDQTQLTLNSSNYWLNIAISVVALIHVVVAFMPELGYDSLAMHLFISAHLLERHQWGFDVSNYLWAVWPTMGDWIFSIVYMLAGETAARLINVFFIFVLSWLVRELVLWAGGTLFGARWAVLIFLSSPLTFTESSSLFIESIWASFAVAGTLAVLKTCSHDKYRTHQLTVAGGLLGCALAAKAITFTFLPVLLLILILQYKTWLRFSTASILMLGLGIFLIFGCVPYITAWWITGNPVFPFFNELFHSTLVPVANFEDTRWSKGLTWDFIYCATFQTGKYLESTPGAAGFQWLLVFLPVMAILVTAWHKRGITLVVLAVLSIILCFHSIAYLRYIFPAYAILVASIGVGITLISKISVIQSKLLYSLGIMAVVLNIIFLSAGPFVYRDFPIKSIVSETHKEAYLAHRLPIRNAVKLVNALNLHRTPVAVFGEPKTAGLTADALYANQYNYAWLNALMAIQTTQDLVDLLLKNHVNFIITDSSSQQQKMQRELLDRVTIKVAQFDTISILKLNDEFRFKKELLKNSSFNTMEGWVLEGESYLDVDSKTVVVSETSPVTQSISVSAGQQYKNTVIARCYQAKAQGRAQVTWQDANGHSISSDIQLFICTADWQEISMEVIAPANAAKVIVYVTGHTATPLEFKSVSFRE